jgi:pyruvate dehydrogenase E2 component (dihydrolipoamide acetyltransferase)
MLSYYVDYVRPDVISNGATMYEFKLPDVGEGIHEAEILRWLVNVGDTIEANQPILEIQTDKAVVEIPSPVSGTIADIKTKAGTLAEVGDVLITIATADGQKGPAAKPTNSQPATSPAAPATPGLAGPGQRVLAAPAVRKQALELGINLADVPASGPAGRVLPSDLRRYVEEVQTTPEPAVPALPPTPPAASPPARPAETPVPVRLETPGREIVDEEPLQGLRRRIAERMEVAWQIPHVTSFEEFEVSQLVALRQQLKAEAEQRGVRLTYLPFIIKAVVQALKAFPYFNASLDMAQRKILHHRYYHIGVATAVPDGLLVPVVRHADRLNLIQLAQELTRLSELARERKLAVAELSGSTFTITNFGSYGSRLGTPIINPPEVAILGTGRIEEMPLAVDGQILIRPQLPLALSYDHRLIDGAAAGQFVRKLKTLLSDPKLLLLELV